MAKKRTNRKPHAPAFVPERAACMLAEAELLGDKRIAKRWGCSVRTLERYRARAVGDPELTALVAAKRLLLGEDWRLDAVRATRRLLERVVELAEEAGVEQMRDVAGALKIAGDLITVKEALGQDHVVRANPAGSDPQAPPPAGRADGEAAPATPIH